MVMKFIELLNDEDVLRKLKSALYPQALADKLDQLTQTITGLTSQLGSKEKRITALEEKVERLEGERDNVEQYSRRNTQQWRVKRNTFKSAIPLPRKRSSCIS